MVSIMNHCWLESPGGRRDFDDVEDWQDELESGADTPEVCCNPSKVIACVRAAVARLPTGQRQVLDAGRPGRIWLCRSGRDSGYSGGPVMSRLSRARAI